MSGAPVYRYPSTYDERLRWHAIGTQPPVTPYTSDAPDALRDGLLKGWRDHQRETAR